MMCRACLLTQLSPPAYPNQSTRTSGTGRRSLIRSICRGFAPSQSLLPARQAQLWDAGGRKAHRLQGTRLGQSWAETLGIPLLSCKLTLVSSFRPKILEQGLDVPGENKCPS